METNVINSVDDNKKVSNVTNVLAFLHICQQLKQTKRTGWLYHGIKNPESISDHMHRMSILALLCDDDSLDRDRCVKMAVVHDLAESKVGDITPLDGVSKEEKHRLEEEAMLHLCTDLLGNTPQSKEIFELWQEYENAKTAEALFVKDLDKFEMILQASEYEQSDQKDLTEFFESASNKIRHPLVKRWANELYVQREEYKKKTILGFVS
ncbi:4532_t:CDS:2 [Ambispora gerdemannii]|uniref:5'-deoxynucleotidase n=1 Tax=Ambispora gerdemannii TaxID=144530 RepID=A0A9N8VIY6_9GLOM|nr:4532_t:CDS:2 [Ambispora gerdemannii]